MAQYEGQLGASGTYRVTAQAYVDALPHRRRHPRGRLRGGPHRLLRHLRLELARGRAEGRRVALLDRGRPRDAHGRHDARRSRSSSSSATMRLRENFTGFLLDVQEPLQTPARPARRPARPRRRRARRSARAARRACTATALGQTQELELGYFARGDQVGGTQQRLEAGDRRTRTRPTPNLDSQLGDIGLYGDANLRAAVAGSRCAAACAPTSSPTTCSTTARCRRSRTRRRRTRPATRAASTQQDFGRPREPNQRASTVERRRSCRAASLLVGPFEHFTFIGERRPGRALGRPELRHAGRQDAVRQRRGVRGRRRVRAARSGRVDARRALGLLRDARRPGSHLRPDRRAATCSASGTTRTGWVGARARSPATFFDESANLTLVRVDLRRHAPARRRTSRTSSSARTRRSSHDLPWSVRGEPIRGALGAGITYVGPRPLPYGAAQRRHLHGRRVARRSRWTHYELGIVAHEPPRHAVPARRVQLRLRLPQPARSRRSCPSARSRPARRAGIFATLRRQLRRRVMRRSRSRLARCSPCAVASPASGTTGGELVDFSAAAAGPADAVDGQPLALHDRPRLRRHAHAGDAPRRRASTSIRACPSRARRRRAASCPAPTSREVTAGLDVDLLSPDAAALSRRTATGRRSAGARRAGLAHRRATSNATPTDATPILVVAGTAVARRRRRSRSPGQITIGANRAGDGRARSPASDPICKQRIVSPIPARASRSRATGGLLLRIDPRLLFVNVDFSQLAESSGSATPSATIRRRRDYSQPSSNLYQNLHAAGALYAFAWDDEPLNARVHPRRGPDSSWMLRTVASKASAAALLLGARVLLEQRARPRRRLGAAIPARAAPRARRSTAARCAVHGAERSGTGRHPLRRLGRGARAHRLRVPARQRGRSRVRRRLGGPLHAAPRRRSTRSRSRTNPDLSPGDPVADRARSSPRSTARGRSISRTAIRRYLPGKGGPGEEAVPIAALASQNKNGNGAFATDGTRYAFGFDVVAADAERPEREPRRGRASPTTPQMIEDGCAVLYVGTATFKGGTVAELHRLRPRARARRAGPTGR